MQFSVLWISRCWANAWLIIKRTLVKSSRMQVNAWSCEKNTFLTFADWRRLIPFTIIAFNRTGANSFIARITVKVYRFSMTEDISNYFAIHRYGGPSTWCYGVKHVRITNFSFKAIIKLLFALHFNGNYCLFISYHVAVSNKDIFQELDKNCDIYRSASI